MKTTRKLIKKPRLLLQRDVVRVLDAQNLQCVWGGFTRSIPKTIQTTGSDQVCCV